MQIFRLQNLPKQKNFLHFGNLHMGNLPKQISLVWFWQLLSNQYITYQYTPQLAASNCEFFRISPTKSTLLIMMLTN